MPVVKQSWCQSSHNKPLLQIMQTITCLDKLLALWQVFKQWGMLVGSVVDSMALQFAGEQPLILPWMGSSMDATHSDDNDDDNNNNDVDIEPISGPRMKTEIWFPC